MSIGGKNPVYTTQEVAEILGVSVTTVKQLVEAGEIEAWKTRGGHRRIPVASVHAYQAALNQGKPSVLIDPGNSGLTRILVIEDDPLQRTVYQTKISSWNLPVDVRYCENGYQGLVQVLSFKPDVLLTDIVMEGIDGYEVIKTILGYPELAAINIAILTSLEYEVLDAHPNIPLDAVYFSKPVNFDELRGFLRACCSHKKRLQRLTVTSPLR